MARPAARRRPLRIAFVHPDLGLGGAERLIVDAAVELSDRGHDVTIYTAHHDPARCFKETVNGPFAVRVAGAWFPRTLGGRAVALCAYIRCILAALRLAWDSWRSATPVDAVIADQVSAVVPFLHASLTAPVLFYCHFPDLLLASRGRDGDRGGGVRAMAALAARAARSLYRAPLDALEQATTGAADALFVNSAFTARVFAATFPRVAAARAPPAVLYPATAIPTDADLAAAAAAAASDDVLPAAVRSLAAGNRPLFVSVNRFERKKGLPLALRALAEVHASRRHGDKAPLPSLVFAGGYDTRLPENVSVLAELKEEAVTLGVASSVAFLPSFSDAQRAALLALARAVVYTPVDEHFGIVPLEAGAAGVAVIACASGGPTETVLPGKTGYLCDPAPASFGAALAELAGDADHAATLGAAARARVSAQFSRAAFGDALEASVVDAVESKQQRRR